MGMATTFRAYQLAEGRRAVSGAHNVLELDLVRIHVQIHQAVHLSFAYLTVCELCPDQKNVNTYNYYLDSPP